MLLFREPLISSLYGLCDIRNAYLNLMLKNKSENIKSFCLLSALHQFDNFLSLSKLMKPHETTSRISFKYKTIIQTSLNDALNNVYLYLKAFYHIISSLNIISKVLAAISILYFNLKRLRIDKDKKFIVKEFGISMHIGNRIIRALPLTTFMVRV